MQRRTNNERRRATIIESQHQYLLLVCILAATILSIAFALGSVYIFPVRAHHRATGQLPSLLVAPYWQRAIFASIATVATLWSVRHLLIKAIVASRAKANRCLHCGYSLDLAPTTKCPECGESTL